MKKFISNREDFKKNQMISESVQSGKVFLANLTLTSMRFGLPPEEQKKIKLSEEQLRRIEKLPSFKEIREIAGLNINVSKVTDEKTGVTRDITTFVEPNKNIIGILTKLRYLKIEPATKTGKYDVVENGLGIKFNCSLEQIVDIKDKLVFYANYINSIPFSEVKDGENVTTLVSAEQLIDKEKNPLKKLEALTDALVMLDEFRVPDMMLRGAWGDKGITLNNQFKASLNSVSDEKKAEVRKLFYQVYLSLSVDDNDNPIPDNARDNRVAGFIGRILGKNTVDDVVERMKILISEKNVFTRESQAEKIERMNQKAPVGLGAEIVYDKNGFMVVHVKGAVINNLLHGQPITTHCIAYNNGDNVGYWNQYSGQNSLSTNNKVYYFYDFNLGDAVATGKGSSTSDTTSYDVEKNNADNRIIGLIVGEDGNLYDVERGCHNAADYCRSRYIYKRLEDHNLKFEDLFPKMNPAEMEIKKKNVNMSKEYLKYCSELLESSKPVDYKKLDKFFANGADINSSKGKSYYDDKNSPTILEVGIRRGDKELISYAVKNKASIIVCSSTVMNSVSDLNVFKLLIPAGATPNKFIQRAIELDNPKELLELLQMGAFLKKKGSDGFVDYIALAKSAEVIQILKDYGADLSSYLRKLVDTDQVETVRLELKTYKGTLKSNVNDKDSLMHFARSNDMARLLMQYGANPSHYLPVAIMANDYAMLDELFKASADGNYQKDKVYMVNLSKEKKMVEYIVSKGGWNLDYTTMKAYVDVPADLDRLLKLDMGHAKRDMQLANRDEKAATTSVMYCKQPGTTRELVPIKYAVSTKNVESLKVFLKYGFDITFMGCNFLINCATEYVIDGKLKCPPIQIVDVIYEAMKKYPVTQANVDKFEPFAKSINSCFVVIDYVKMLPNTPENMKEYSSSICAVEPDYIITADSDVMESAKAIVKYYSTGLIPSAWEELDFGL